MLELFQLGTIQSNVSLLTLVTLGKNQASSLSYRESYLKSLNRIQEVPIPVEAERPFPFMLFDVEAAQVAPLLARLVSARQQGCWSSVPASEAPAITESVRQSISLLEQWSSQSRQALEILIGCIVVAVGRESGGGSHADALGAIRLSPSPKWIAPDYADCILHETIHQAFFLDEMIRGPFTLPEAEAESVRILSPIRREPRPLYLSFAAAAVAVGLLQLHEYLNLYDRSTAYCLNLLPTILELKKHVRLLTSRGRAVLEEMDTEILQSRTFESACLEILNKNYA